MGVNETSGFLRPMTPHLDAEYWTRSIGASAWETWVTPRIWQTCQSTTSKSTTNPRPPPPPPRLVPEFCFQTAYDAFSVRGTSKKCTKRWWHTCAHVTYLMPRLHETLGGDMATLVPPHFFSFNILVLFYEIRLSWTRFLTQRLKICIY